MRVPYDENTPFELISIVLAMFGPGHAESMTRRLGGNKVYIPYYPEPNSRFSEILGHDRALLLGKELGGVHMYVPKRCPQQDRSIAVARMMAEGKSVAAIATELGLSDRTIYTVRRQLRRAERKFARVPDERP